jgi:hypothetical protein
MTVIAQAENFERGRIGTGMGEPNRWERLPDDEVAGFGRRTIHFSSSDGVYSVEVDKADQNRIAVQVDGVTATWWIVTKEVNDGIYRLNGSSPRGWYELTLGAPATISYWPGQATERIDHELT